MATLLAAVGLASAGAAEPPNLLLIFADDIGYEALGCYGGLDFETPQLDAMAARGIRFERAYTSPVCTPSRVSMHTGLHVPRHGHAGVLPVHRGTDKKVDFRTMPTYAQLLRRRGYRTSVTGKWQLATLERWPDHIREAGFDSWCVWQIWREGRKTLRHWTPTFNQDGALRGDIAERFGPDVLADYVIEQMTEARDAGRPFLIVHNELLPHDPIIDTPDDRAMGRAPSLGHMIGYMDKLVGRLLRAVDDLGLRDNTYVVFMGDNGTHEEDFANPRAGRPGERKHTRHTAAGRVNGGKFKLGDAGTHVPLIVWGPPTIRPGSVCDELVDVVDLFPTFCELSGTAIPESLAIDGRSLAPQIHGRPGARRRWTHQAIAGGGENLFDGSWRLFRRNGALWDARNLPAEPPAAADDPEATAAGARLREVFGKITKEGPRPPEPFPATALDKRKRNVLFIAVDDLRVELGCYGGTPVKSPNIDALAARGLRFDRAYCQQAVCNPSRASALTGLRPETLGIFTLPPHFRDVRPDVVTLPQHFKRHGYHARGIGKIFHNWRQDAWRGDPVSWSVPAVLHYNSHGNDRAQVEGDLPPDLLQLPRCEMRDVPDEAYFDGRIAAEAVRALGGYAAVTNGSPFFLAVGFWKPHLPFNAPRRYWDLYAPSDLDLPVNPARPADAPEIAFHDSRELMRGFRSGGPSEAQVRRLRHGYYAAVSYLDAQVGKVLDELDRLGLRDSTHVVFWSDHGFHLGEHGLWAKTSCFELDARVPLILATADGRAAGRSTEALVELLDLYPTLVDLCGLPAPGHLEGVSLLPLLDDPGASVKPAAYTWHPRPAYPAKPFDAEAMGHSMRTPTHRYTEWRDFKTDEILARELYDHRVDPRETRNVAAQADLAPFEGLLRRSLP